MPANSNTADVIAAELSLAYYSLLLQNLNARKPLDKPQIRDARARYEAALKALGKEKKEE